MTPDPLSLAGDPFPVTSRYHGVGTAILTVSGRGDIAYLLRRFLPPSGRFTVLEEHVVAEGDRLDNLSARYLGDPEQSWRLCDANDAMRPDELTERVGRRLRITLPEGIPGGAGG